MEGLGYKKFEDFDVHRIRSIFPLEKTVFTRWISFYKLLFVKNQFDVLHLSGIGTFSTLIVLLLDKFNRNKRPCIVISDHTDTRTHNWTGFYADINYLFFRLCFGILGNRVSSIVTFDKVGVEVLSKRYNIPASRFRIIELGYDSDLFVFDPALRNSSSKMVVGFAGKIDPKKRIEVLLNALAKSKCSTAVKLIVAGVKENNKYTTLLKRIAEDNKLDVDFRPLIKTAELAKFYQYINLAVFPGGISITTIEANGCGTPVVVFRSIEGLEIRVADGRGQLFAEETELIAAIENYYELFAAGKIDYRKISEATAATASWKDLSKKYLSVYRNE